MSFSLGLVEVESLGHAIAMTDEMLKAANVEFVATERRLGGRLVTIIIRGELSAVTASVETGRNIAEKMGCLKSAEVIARPHNEILKFLHLDNVKISSKKEDSVKIVTSTAELQTNTSSENKKRSKAVSLKAVSDKAPAKRSKKTK